MRRFRSRNGTDGLGSADDVAAKLRALEQMDGPPYALSGAGSIAPIRPKA